MNIFYQLCFKVICIDYMILFPFINSLLGLMNLKMFNAITLALAFASVILLGKVLYKAIQLVAFLLFYQRRVHLGDINHGSSVKSPGIGDRDREGIGVFSNMTRFLPKCTHTCRL